MKKNKSSARLVMECKEKFIEALIAGKNQKEAAIAAGYSPKSAKVKGCQLAKDPEVRAALAARHAAVMAKMELTTERTLREVARVAYFDPRKLFDAQGNIKAIHELDDDAAAAVAMIEIDEINAGGAVVGHTKKIKAWDKNAALEKAMKHLGQYEADNKQIQPVMPAVIQVVPVEPAKRR